MISTISSDYNAKGSAYAVAVAALSRIDFNLSLCVRIFAVALLLETLRRMLRDKLCSYLSLDPAVGVRQAEPPRHDEESTETANDFAPHVLITISARVQPSKALMLYKDFSAKNGHVDFSKEIQEPQHAALSFYAALVQCADRAQHPEYVMRLLEDMDEAGIERSLEIYESAIQVFTKWKLFEEAIKVSERVDQDALKPTPVTLSRLVGCAVELGDVDRANDFFKRLCSAPLQEALVKASLTMLRLFAKKEDWISSLAVFKQIRATSMEIEPILLNVALATGVASGELEAAKALLMEEHRVADVMSHNTILKGLAQQGEVDAVLEFLDQMEASGVTPDAISFNTAIDAAVRANQANEAWRLFEIMQKEHGINPDKCTCSTLVKGFTKSATSDQVTRMLALIDDVFDDCSSQLRNNLLSGTLDAALRIKRVDLALRICGKKSFQHMGSYGVAACWRSLSRLSNAEGSWVHRDAHLLEPLLQHTISAAETGNLDAQALASVVHGVTSSKLGRSSGSLFDVLAEAVKLKLSHFDEQDLVSTAWAFAMAGQSDTSLFVALAEAAKLKLSEFKAQHLANTAWAFAKASQFDASFFAAVAEAAKLKLRNFNAQDVANMAWAFAKAGQSDTCLFAALAETAKPRLKEFNQQDLANTAWAFATAGQSNASLFDALAFAVALKLNDFGAHSLANTAWAFAKNGHYDASLFDAIAVAAKLRMSNFNAQDIANTAWAFAKVCHSDASLFVALAEAATLHINWFSAQDLTNMAWAFTRAAPDTCIASKNLLDSLTLHRIHHGQSGQWVAEGQ